MYTLLLPPPQLGYGRFLSSKFITCQFAVNHTLSHSKKPLIVLLSVTVVSVSDLEFHLSGITENVFSLFLTLYSVCQTHPC